jgi:hypothetical protein
MNLKNTAMTLALIGSLSAPLCAQKKTTKEEENKKAKRAEYIKDAKDLGKVILFGALSSACYVEFGDFFNKAQSHTTKNLPTSIAPTTPEADSFLKASAAKVFLPILGGFAIYTFAKLSGRCTPAKEGCEVKDDSHLTRNSHEAPVGGCC